MHKSQTFTIDKKWKKDSTEPVRVRHVNGSEKLIYPSGKIKWIKEPKKKKGK